MSFAIAGTVLTIGATAYGASQAGKAADAQVRGADRATAESARQYDQTRRDLAPWRTVGGGAENRLGQLFGLGGSAAGGGQDWSGRDLFGTQGGIPTVDSERYAADPAYRQAWDQTLAAERSSPAWRNQGASTYYAPGTNADFARLNDSLTRGIADYNTAHPNATGPAGSGTPDMSAFFQSPGYQFRRSEGTRGLERTAAAQGGAFSGNALKALAEFNSGLASQEFGNYVNQLSAIASGGQSATDSTAAFGANAANQAGRNALYAGDARASGIADRANIIGSGINALGGIAGYYSNRKKAYPMGGDGFPIWEDG